MIDDSAYVLTLDYAIKMLNIHERYNCGVPVIIEGETGVGKTFLVEMLSKLWNQSHLLKWNTQRSSLHEFFQRELNVDTESEDYQVIIINLLEFDTNLFFLLLINAGMYRCSRRYIKW